ncbi:GntR family transcriptional regulator [Thermodesulfobacteriota bacterium]
MFSSRQKKIKLDSMSRLPLYSQLEDIIRQQINDGILKEDQLVPSENEIAAEYKISIGTVRKALNNLTREGILFRKQGKGTFVVRPDFREFYYHDFSSKLRNSNDISLPIPKILNYRIKIAQGNAKEKLELSKDEKVIVTNRLLFQNKTPIIQEHIYLSEKYFRNFAQSDFVNDPLYPLYSDKYQVPIVGADSYFEPSISSRTVAKALNIKQGNSVIIIETIAYTSGDKPVEYRICVGRGDFFRHHIAMGRTKYNRNKV